MAGAEAFEIVALCDAVSNILSDCGMRYFPLSSAESFSQVREAMVGRATRALGALEARVVASGDARALCGGSWSAADIALYCLVTWLEGLPARAAGFPPAAQVVSLGWSLPTTLSRWADRHRERADVAALG
jgi:glutathione S-transferase